MSHTLTHANKHITHTITNRKQARTHANFVPALFDLNKTNKTKYMTSARGRIKIIATPISKCDHHNFSYACKWTRTTNNAHKQSKTIDVTRYKSIRNENKRDLNK